MSDMCVYVGMDIFILEYRFVCVSVGVCVGGCLYGLCMHHFPGGQNMKMHDTALSSSIHQSALQHRHEKKNSHIMRMAKYAERMSCHLLSNFQLWERETARNKLRSEELNTTPHQTLKSDGV